MSGNSSINLRTAIQNHNWNRRASTWDHGSMPGLEKIAAAVLAHAGDLSGLDVADLGCGSGQLTLEVARQAKSVIGIDFAAPMLRILEERASAQGLFNVETRHGMLQTLSLPDASVDVIVSNYALHHLRHPEKADLLQRAARWLRPGGTIVVGDMMFSVSTEAADRQIIASKVTSMLRKGPAGWWRITKNLWRFTLGREECPASMGAWSSMLQSAGFVDIRSERVVAEAAVVSARRPESPARQV